MTAIIDDARHAVAMIARFPISPYCPGHSAGRSQRQKFLNRSGASSVYRTVCWMFLWPSQACSARVSWPAFARAQPQPCRSERSVSGRLGAHTSSNHTAAHASCSVSDCEPGLVVSLIRLTPHCGPHLTQIVLSSHSSMTRKRDFFWGACLGASCGGSDSLAPVRQQRPYPAFSITPELATAFERGSPGCVGSISD